MISHAPARRIAAQLRRERNPGTGPEMSGKTQGIRATVTLWPHCGEIDGDVWTDGAVRSFALMAGVIFRLLTGLGWKIALAASSRASFRESDPGRPCGPPRQCLTERFRA
jgi:hypothetical protein